MKRMTILVIATMLLVPSVAGATATRGTAAYNKMVIRQVFGKRHGSQAVAVAWCESRLYTWARNGQFQGLFQVSSALRRDYKGFGPGAWRQARHARRVFNASGKSWWRHWRWSAQCWNK